jgi:hypothetical protein
MHLSHITEGKRSSADARPLGTMIAGMQNAKGRFGLMKRSLLSTRNAASYPLQNACTRTLRCKRAKPFSSHGESEQQIWNVVRYCQDKSVLQSSGMTMILRQ